MAVLRSLARLGGRALGVTADLAGGAALGAARMAARGAPAAARFTGRAAAYLARPAEEAAMTAAGGLYRLAGSMVRPASRHGLLPLELTPLGKAVAIGGFAAGAAGNILETNRQEAMGEVEGGPRALPALNYDAVPNDLGAGGDLVLALNRLRHG